MRGQKKKTREKSSGQLSTLNLGLAYPAWVGRQLVTNT
jgi:hypothetical protein